MDKQQLIHDITQKSNAIIEFCSGDKEVCYFPYSLICDDNSEAFISIRKEKSIDVIEFRLRIYTDNQDNNILSYTLNYGKPPKSIPLGNSFRTVKSSRKEAYVARVCSRIPLEALLDIINLKAFSLSDGDTSKAFKISCDITKLSLFLASWFSLDALTDDLKDLLTPLIQEEENRISQERKEQKREREEEKERQRQKEEARIKQQEADRKKQQEEKALLVKNTKRLLETMWNLYPKINKGDFCITKYENEYCVQVDNKGIMGKDLGSEYYEIGRPSREQLFKMLRLLRDANIINDYRCKENSNVVSDAIVAYIPGYYDHLPPLFRICSLQQLYDVLDNKTTVKDIQNKASNSPLSSNNQATNNGCYIATAIYGSYDCPEVWTLRRFRDYSLAQTWFGRLFIKTYYAVSPTLVKWFGYSEWFKLFWRKPLDSIVTKLRRKGFEDSPYQDRYLNHNHMSH